ncbi:MULTISPECIES: bifunctional 5,10-methylenetetrahydrofolate dehydrogenase/5,10-methenyltetrahydrofolate cyclohydrolase [Lachnospiraceae]|uniref:bifunctional 5,10-methylenetetrahydrofolate dehydrogenase/5,10-methenyltetrahydrofolate cyclohydrolase n=1 Tax=Lachnospiraceae TaxID=186803 RepID=UPI001F1E26F8|nr:bifunctional 5,10-methylenetetrahydrofolate dehydrogenase/5,10-methenyltetrahydrofolate cyclohydrolase [Faecalicatena contorta]MCF2667534.1 bifunctional 5,10-methylenetetrahydrofolate dehydrogenase/5,10-methenyltetrahydrofolate cyclohydrolase [Faecalicatena contorta]
MSVLMKGADVANAMKAALIEKVEVLKEKGTIPCLTIVRVGNRPDDLSYERGAKKRMEAIGIECRIVELPEDISQDDFEQEFGKVNDDPSVHGILLFRPLPKQLDEEPIKAMIHPEKDMDCMSPVNIAKIFAGDETGYAPCTAEAVMEMLDYYEIDPKGKRVTVVGRSMVVGKPLSMMLLKQHATITVCHTRTVNLPEVCRNAEILVAAAGKARIITADMVGEGAVVADVGINVDEDGKMCGDVAFEEVEPKTSYISPVPRGVGSITTSVLAKHVVRAASLVNKESL